MFEKALGPGEAIDIEPGGWLYKDSSVRMDTITDRLTSGLFGGVNFIVNRFTGPALAFNPCICTCRAASESVLSSERSLVPCRHRPPPPF